MVTITTISVLKKPRKEKPVSSKLRVALAKTRELLGIAQDPQVSQDMILKARKLISKALAEPARNCDVGTPKEQALRFDQFCNSFPSSCEGCPCAGLADECKFAWAQMPYTENHITGWHEMCQEVWHYLSQGVDCFTVSSGPWTVKYDNIKKGESDVKE